MKPTRIFIACTLIGVLAAPNAPAAETAPSLSGSQVRGLGIGSIAGGIAGGPLGLVLGGVIGNLIGWSDDLQSDLRQSRDERKRLERQRDELRAALDTANRRIGELERKPDPAPFLQAIAQGPALVIHFRSASSVLEPHERERLQRLARLCHALPGIGLQLTGHADPRGDNRSNLLLSQDRLKAVQDFLLEAGVPREHLSGNAFGEARPLSATGDSGAYAFDRRVEVRFRVR
jgi:outer membrane protein OmpA-like peptidoglycan-associated protein